MNPLKKKNFITEIQCKTDIYFPLILSDIYVFHFDIVHPLRTGGSSSNFWLLDKFFYPKCEPKSGQSPNTLRRNKDELTGLHKTL